MLKIRSTPEHWCQGTVWKGRLFRLSAVEALQYSDRVEFVPVRPLKAMRGFLRGIDTRVPRERDRL